MAIDINALISLTGGPAPVTLGSISFNKIEVPHNIPWGGKHMLHIHKLPGGARVINAMGRDDRDLEWGGYLEGPSALQRARQLDVMRVSGLPVTLSWDSLTFVVLVEDFRCDYRHHNWMLYTIRCVVQQDKSAQGVASQNTLASALGIDLSAVQDTVLPIAADVSSAVTIAQDAVAVAGAFAPNSKAFRSLQVGLAQAQGACTDAVTAANGDFLGALGSTFGILGQTQARGAVTSLINLTGAGGNLAGSLQQLGYVNRAASNLGNSVTPVTATPLPTPSQPSW